MSNFVCLSIGLLQPPADSQVSLNPRPLCGPHAGCFNSPNSDCKHVRSAPALPPLPSSSQRPVLLKFNPPFTFSTLFPDWREYWGHWGPAGKQGGGGVLVYVTPSTRIFYHKFIILTWKGSFFSKGHAVLNIRWINNETTNIITHTMATNNTYLLFLLPATAYHTMRITQRQPYFSPPP